jgi:hypothetical protein
MCAVYYLRNDYDYRVSYCNPKQYINLTNNLHPNPQPDTHPFVLRQTVVSTTKSRLKHGVVPKK